MKPGDGADMMSSGTSCNGSLPSRGSGPYPVIKDGVVGFLDHAMSWAIPPRFVNAGQFHEGLAVAAVHPGNFGLINVASDFVSLDTYQDARRMSEGRAAVETPEGWGFVDRSGRVVIRPVYPEASRFSEGLAAVSAVRHDTAAAWLNDDAYGYILPTGEPAFAVRFQVGGMFSDGHAPARRSGKWGLIDRRGEWAIPNLYDSVTCWRRDMACFRLGRGQFRIDTSGRVLEQTDDDPELWCGSLQDGLRVIKSGDLYGYVDASNVIRIPATFGTARPFSNGRSTVRSRRKWGLIDVAGRFVVAPELNWLLPIGDLFYFVRKRENGYMDREGKTLWSGPLGSDVVYRMLEFSRELAES